MHPCLATRDIVEGICYRIDEGYQSEEAILSFALTCKTICEVAMGVLWGCRRISLQTIVLTLSDDYLEKNWNPNIDIDDPLGFMGWTEPIQRVTLSRNPESNELDRFDYYRSKVRTLGLGDDEIDIDSSVFQHLDQGVKWPLFPNLIELQISMIRSKEIEHLFPFIRLFVAPSLVKLELTGMPRNPDISVITGILEPVANICRDLEELSLTVWTGQRCFFGQWDIESLQFMDDLLSKTVSWMKKLHTFESVGLPLGSLTVTSLAELPQLKTWEVDITLTGDSESGSNRTLSWCPSSTSEWHLRADDFPGLDQVKMHTFDFCNRAESFLKSMGSRNLTSINVTSKEWGTQDPCRFVAALESHPSLCSLLRHLEINSFLSAQMKPKEMEKALNPLSSLVRLEYFALRLRSWHREDAPPSEESVLALLKSWTDLQTLIIGWGTDVANFTLQSLLLVLQRSPKLKKVEMTLLLEPFDLASMPKGVANSYITTIGDRSTKFCNGDSAHYSCASTRELKAIAKCLYTMFPNLVNVSTMYWTCEVWTKFETILRNERQGGVVEDPDDNGSDNEENKLSKCKIQIS